MSKLIAVLMVLMVGCVAQTEETEPVDNDASVTVSDAGSVDKDSSVDMDSSTDAQADAPADAEPDAPIETVTDTYEMVICTEQETYKNTTNPTDVRVRYWAEMPFEDLKRPVDESTQVKVLLHHFMYNSYGTVCPRDWDCDTYSSTVTPVDGWYEGDNWHLGPNGAIKDGHIEIDCGRYEWGDWCREQNPYGHCRRQFGMAYVQITTQVQ